MMLVTEFLLEVIDDEDVVALAVVNLNTESKTKRSIPVKILKCLRLKLKKLISMFVCLDVLIC
jgi:hypothetical protein